MFYIIKMSQLHLKLKLMHNDTCRTLQIEMIFDRSFKQLDKSRIQQILGEGIPFKREILTQ